MDTSALRQFLLDSFNIDELRDLCFTLKINHEDLGGDNRAALARELVAHCERHDRLAELESTARQLADDYASGQRARPTGGTSVSNVSGGVTLNATTINITGDVTGRDKLTSGAAAATPTLRATPPRPPEHFTGRKADLEKFTRLITSGQNVAITALHGMGGIGKTSLALKLAEQIGRGDPDGRPYFPGGVLWWSLGPNPDVITALDVWARHADPNSNLKDYPTAGARAEIVRPMLAKLGKLCVIIDDVWDAESFNVLRSAVPAGCPLLMTTRDGDLAKTLRCRVERIDALSDDEAVDLLVRLLGSLDGNEDAACDIAHLTGGLPLALELIAGLADSPADLPALATRLRARSPLDVLKRGTTREQSIETCFTLSYEHLDADLQRRFCALGVFALAPFERAAIAAVWAEDDDAERVDESIRQLVRRSLLSKVDGTDEYRQHALLHDYALRLLSEPSSQPSPLKGEGGRAAPGEGDKPFARHADYYRTFAKTQNWRAVEHAFDQIEHGWQWVQAHAPDRIISYINAVTNFLDTRGRKVEWLAWSTIGLTQARIYKSRRDEGAFCNNIGEAYDDLGQSDKALDYYQQALIILREVGDRGGEGAALSNIGRVHRVFGDLPKALDIQQEALSIHREVGNRSLEGTTLHNIGHIHKVRGQLQEAIDCYLRALAIHREVGDLRMEAMTLMNLGAVYRTQGKMRYALDFYQQALSLSLEIGDRRLEGTILNNIGEVHGWLGEIKAALEVYQQSLNIHRETGNRLMEGTTLNNIGKAQYDLSNFQNALDTYQEALTVSREVNHRVGEVTALNNIGLAHYSLGDTQKALVTFQLALAICHETDNRLGEILILNNIGGLYDILGQKTKALDTFKQALAISREVGDRPNEGTILCNIGTIYESRGQMQEALDTFKQARSILRETEIRQSEYGVIFNIGLVLEKMGRTFEAVLWLKKCVDLMEVISHPELAAAHSVLERLRGKLGNG